MSDIQPTEPTEEQTFTRALFAPTTDERESQWIGDVQPGSRLDTTNNSTNN